MINIEDYLDPIDPLETLPSGNGAEVIDFNGEPSREEIGKWVDKVMDLPAELNTEDYVIESNVEIDESCYQLADLLISNDLI